MSSNDEWYLIILCSTWRLKVKVGMCKLTAWKLKLLHTAHWSVFSPIFNYLLVMIHWFVCKQELYYLCDIAVPAMLNRTHYEWWQSRLHQMDAVLYFFSDDNYVLKIFHQWKRLDGTAMYTYYQHGHRYDANITWVYCLTMSAVKHLSMKLYSLRPNQYSESTPVFP